MGVVFFLERETKFSKLSINMLGRRRNCLCLKMAVWKSIWCFFNETKNDPVEGPSKTAQIYLYSHRKKCSYSSAKYDFPCCITKWVLCKLLYFRKLILFFLIHYIWIFETHLLYVFSNCFIVLDTHTSQRKQENKNQ